jgi:putative tricarboxylic transport membrane protein
MFEGLQHLIQGIVNLLTFTTLFHIAWATLLGICVGMLPGLTATLGLTLLTTLTLGLSPEHAVMILISMYVGAIFGGSRSAILLNIPGTPANAATALDGFPLARSGNVGQAMGIATVGSVFGTMIGMLCLAFFAPLLAEFALRFQSYEFFWLAVFGVVISGRLTATDDPLKGWIAGFLGLLVAMVGQEGMHAYPRYSYGVPDLAGGFELLAVLVGVFGFAEILSVMKSPAYKIVKGTTDSVIPRIRDVLRYWRTIIRSGISGTFMGLIPGVGEDMGAWVSYALARNASKEKEKFGKGSLDGLIASQTGCSASVPGAIIPVLTLAIPGSAPAAVLLAALFIHGVEPGPLIMATRPDFVFEVVAMILFASLAMLIFGLLLTKPLLKVLAVPRDKLMPIVFVLCTVGAFAVSSRLFDVWVMLGFGVLGFVLREMRFPMAPLVLGVVLGPILDNNLRRGLVLGDGDLTPFFTRPISAVLWVTILLTFLLGIPTVVRMLQQGGRSLRSALRRGRPA